MGSVFDKPGDGAFDFFFGEETGLAQFVWDFGSDRMIAHAEDAILDRHLAGFWCEK